MYTLGDMIRNRTTTMTSDGLLQSAGEVNIVATQNGQEVFANNYGIGFKQSAALTQPMCLYYGSMSNADSVVTWDIADTTKNGTVVPGTIVTNDTIIANENVYLFNGCTSFNWVNCDHFNNGYSGKSLTVTLPDTSYNSSNTSIYIIFPDLNAVMSNVQSLGGTLSTTQQILTLTSEGNSNIIPDGAHYKLVILSDQNHNFYYNESSGTVSGNLNMFPIFESKTPTEIVTLLLSL